MKAEGDRPGALLLGGGPATLSAARSLRRQGIRVCNVGPADSLARFSRAVDRFVQYPRGLPDEELPAFLIALAARLRLQGWVLFPGNDEQVRVVAQHHAQLARHFVLTTPPWATVEPLYDKRLTYALARQVGVPIPPSWAAGSAAQLAAQAVVFPVVLKPAITPHLIRASPCKAYRANDPQELQAGYAALTRVIPAAEVIVQEYLPDPAQNLYSYAGCFRDGEPVAGLAVQRPRQYPRDFGWASTCVVATELPALRDLAVRLLRPLRYTGLAEVEFMWQARRAQFELLEVNARMWGWLGLAVAAGLDLPYVAYAQALGTPVAGGIVRPGTRWVRLLMDLRAAAPDLLAGRLGLRQYLASLRGTAALAVFAPADPLPVVLETGRILFQALPRRAVARLRGRGRHRAQD